MGQSRCLLGTFAGFGVVALLHCGGQAASSPVAAVTPAGSGGTGQAAGGSGGAPSAAAGSVASGGACGGAHSTPVGRPQGASCVATRPGQALPDAGSVVCASDADCADAGVAQKCLNRECSVDRCLVDGDCTTGQACNCENASGSSVSFAGNACLPSQCRVDSDCGSKGICSPSYYHRCGAAVVGYYCHSSADACNTDSDCCGATPFCAYQTTLGHWACEAVTVCNG